MTDEQFANLLLANLIQASPKRTGNMARNIKMTTNPNYYRITIAKGVPYARAVNYNWARRDDESKKSYEERGLHKEKENYMWVERVIKATANSMGGVVRNELY
jgi:hypothetical protein